VSGARPLPESEMKVGNTIYDMPSSKGKGPRILSGVSRAGNHTTPGGKRR